MKKSPNDPKRPSGTAMEEVKENAVELNDEQIKDTETTPEVEESLKKSIEAYRNVRIGTKELSEKELEKIDKECEV